MRDKPTLSHITIALIPNLLGFSWDISGFGGCIRRASIIKGALVILFSLAAVYMMPHGIQAQGNPADDLTLLIEDASSHLFVLYARHQTSKAAFAQAVAWIDRAQERQPNSAYLYTISGEIALLLYEWDDAMQDFDYAIGINSSYAEAYFHRAILYYTMANREAAMTDLTTYLMLDENGRWRRQAHNYIISIKQELAALRQ